MDAGRQATLIEWMSLMLELAETDREEYRRVRADAWDRVARCHNEKSPEQREEWSRNAS